MKETLWKHNKNKEGEPRGESKEGVSSTFLPEWEGWRVVSVNFRGPINSPPPLYLIWEPTERGEKNVSGDMALDPQSGGLQKLYYWLRDFSSNPWLSWSVDLSPACPGDTQADGRDLHVGNLSNGDEKFSSTD